MTQLPPAQTVFQGRNSNQKISYFMSNNSNRLLNVDEFFFHLFVKERKNGNVVEGHPGKAFVIVMQIRNDMICKNNRLC